MSRRTRALERQTAETIEYQRQVQKALEQPGVGTGLTRWERLSMRAESFVVGALVAGTLRSFFGRHDHDG